MKPAARQSTPSRRSFAEHKLDTEPNRPDEPGCDDCNYGLERIALHAAKDDDAVAGCLYLVVEYFKLMTETERRDLAFDQPLARLRQSALRFSNANCRRATLGLAGLDQKLAEKMRFSRTASAMSSFVTPGRQQRLKYFCGRYFQDGQ